VLIEDKLPGYISKQQFEENQKKLWENASKYRIGTAMRGTSMLAGRVVCGHCGRHMSVSYSGQSKERLTCEMSRNQWGEKQCQGFNARSLNEHVSSLLLQAISPASIELSLKAFSNLDQELRVVERHHARTVERAQYESDLAYRRYGVVAESTHCGRNAHSLSITTTGKADARSPRADRNFIQRHSCLVERRHDHR